MFHSKFLDLFNQAEAIVFDFDGTILDTETYAFKAWQTLFRRHGQTLDMGDYIQCVGSGYGNFHPAKHLKHLASLTKTALTKSVEELVSEKDLLKADFCSRLTVIPEINGLIGESIKQNKKIAIASSSNFAWVGSHCRRLGLDQIFKVIVCKDDVETTKPAPDLFLAAASKLEVDPGKCLVIEDSKNGIIAALKARMKVVAIANSVTKYSNLDGANLYLSGPEELLS